MRVDQDLISPSTVRWHTTARSDSTFKNPRKDRMTTRWFERGWASEGSFLLLVSCVLSSRLAQRQDGSVADSGGRGANNTLKVLADERCSSDNEPCIEAFEGCC